MVKNPPANAGDARGVDLIPGSGRSPEGGKWQPIPKFLHGKFHGQRSLVGYSPWGHKKSDIIEVTEHSCTHSASSVQLLSCVQLFATPWTAACQASLSFNLSQHQSLFKRVSSLHQVAKYWSFSFSISPSNEYSGLISFGIDWFDLLAVQETLKSLLQHHSSKASILRRSAFFMVQLSHPYMTIGKTITLTRQTFVGKVMSLLFNMLSRLVIAFLPRSKRILILWLESPSAVILEPKKVVSHCFHCFPIYLP